MLSADALAQIGDVVEAQRVLDPLVGELGEHLLLHGENLDLEIHRLGLALEGGHQSRRPSRPRR